MQFEFNHNFDTTPDLLWSALLDPQRVACCVPGMQSVDVISDKEYAARIKVKIAFISAQFDIRTIITETRSPVFLRAEASGQDNSVGSSVKALVEMHLAPGPDRGTDLRVTARADVLGRLGALGLAPMRTKADRMWDQFCAALEANLAGGADVHVAPAPLQTALPSTALPAAPVPAKAKPGLFARLRSWPYTSEFRLEFEKNGARVVLCCPASQASECLAWVDRQIAKY